MTKQEGIAHMESLNSDLLNAYKRLEDLFMQAKKPISPVIQAKAEEIIRSSVSVTCMALNFKEMPQEAKKPFAALLYAAADALTGGEERYAQKR